jgi:hypothetical protein
MEYNKYMENNKNLPITEYEMPDLIMLTYPRSGRHWLYWNIMINTDLKVNFFHGMDQGIGKEYYEKNILVPVITVVRSPEECLASINTMEKNTQFEHRLNDYINHYDFILSNADMFFLYEDLRENTPKILEAICKKYGGNVIGSNSDYDEYEKWYKETQNPFKLITSKESILYQDTLKHTESLDLSKHKELYLAAKNKAIKL